MGMGHGWTFRRLRLALAGTQGPSSKQALGGRSKHARQAQGERNAHQPHRGEGGGADTGVQGHERTLMRVCDDDGPLHILAAASPRKSQAPRLAQIALCP
jgi:hypothetical protein